MPRFRLKQSVGGTPDAVFQSIADVTSGATWPPTVRGATREDSGAIGEGSQFRLSVRGFGEQLVEVVTFEPPGSVVLRTKSSLLDVVHVYRLEPEGSDRTAVHHEVRATVSRVGMLAAPVLYPALWVGLRLEARALRRYHDRRGT